MPKPGRYKTSSFYDPFSACCSFFLAIRRAAIRQACSSVRVRARATGEAWLIRSKGLDEKGEFNFHDVCYFSSCNHLRAPALYPATQLVVRGEDVQKTPLQVQTPKNQRDSQDTCHKPEESSSSVCYLTPRCKSTIVRSLPLKAYMYPCGVYFA